MKGWIVVEIEKVPKDCFHCQFINESNCCNLIHKYIDFCFGVDKRHPLCPIELRKPRKGE